MRADRQGNALRIMIRDMRVASDWAKDAREALTAAKYDKVDSILSDIQYRLGMTIDFASSTVPCAHANVKTYHDGQRQMSGLPVLARRRNPPIAMTWD